MAGLPMFYAGREWESMWILRVNAECDLHVPSMALGTGLGFSAAQSPMGSSAGADLQ